MQKGHSSQSANTYLTWQDLLDDAPEDDTASADDKPPLVGDAAVDSPEEIKLPTELQALLEKKERLEDDLKRLTGQGDPDPEDERFKRMYPVKVHTKESRIEERRLRRHDEHQRLLKQRALEAKRSSERLRRRQAEREAEHRRKEVEKMLVQGHWEANRRIALLRGAQDRRQQALWLEQSLVRQRQRAAQQTLAQKKKQQQKEQTQQARMMERSRRAKEQQRLEERQHSKRQEARLDVERQARVETPRGRSSIDESQPKALECLRHRKQESIDLDQRYEGMRQRALQRRREDEALEAHFDRRSKKQNRFS